MSARPGGRAYLCCNPLGVAWSICSCCMAFGRPWVSCTEHASDMEIDLLQTCCHLMLTACVLQNRFDVSDTEPPDDSLQQRNREWQLPVSYLQPPAVARMQAAGQVLPVLDHVQFQGCVPGTLSVGWLLPCCNNNMDWGVQLLVRTACRPQSTVGKPFALPHSLLGPILCLAAFHWIKSAVSSLARLPEPSRYVCILLFLHWLHADGQVHLKSSSA